MKPPASTLSRISATCTGARSRHLTLGRSRAVANRGRIGADRALRNVKPGAPDPTRSVRIALSVERLPSFSSLISRPRALTEDRAAYPHHRRALFHRYVHIVTHAHRQLAQAKQV